MHNALRLVALILALTCAACANSGYYAPWADWFSPPHQSYYSASRTRHRRSEHWRVAHNRRPVRESVARTDVTGSATEIAPAPAASKRNSNPTVTLSLAGNGVDRTHAEHLLNSVDIELKQAHNRHLSQAEQQTYDRATQLAGRARHALVDDDCAAASSLAAKASSLASALGGSER